MPLLEADIAEDPLKGVEFAFNFIKWYILVMGVSAAVSVFLMYNTAAASPYFNEAIYYPHYVTVAAAVEDVVKGRCLSQREIEVANLLVKKALPYL